MNQSYAHVNQPYTTFTLASELREVFGVQLYKNNARTLLSHILSILNSDWLQHARSVREVYELLLIYILDFSSFWRLHRVYKSTESKQVCADFIQPSDGEGGTKRSFLIQVYSPNRGLENWMQSKLKKFNFFVVQFEAFGTEFDQILLTNWKFLKMCEMEILRNWMKKLQMGVLRISASNERSYKM